MLKLEQHRKGLLKTIVGPSQISTGQGILPCSRAAYKTFGVRCQHVSAIYRSKTLNANANMYYSSPPFCLEIYLPLPAEPEKAVNLCILRTALTSYLYSMGGSGTT